MQKNSINLEENTIIRDSIGIYFTLSSIALKMYNKWESAVEIPISSNLYIRFDKKKFVFYTDSGEKVVLCELLKSEGLDYQKFFKQAYNCNKNENVFLNKLFCKWVKQEIPYVVNEEEKVLKKQFKQ